MSLLFPADAPKEGTSILTPCVWRRMVKPGFYAIKINQSVNPDTSFKERHGDRIL
ncbi:hypothetical protein AVEN_84889-1, partial [Araneus ventricosus]